MMANVFAKWSDWEGKSYTGILIHSVLCDSKKQTAHFLVLRSLPLIYPALAGRHRRLHLKARLHATAFDKMAGVDAVLDCWSRSLASLREVSHDGII